MSDTYRDPPPEPKCLRCDSALSAIHVVDHAYGGVFVGLAYTVDEPDKSLWSGGLKNAAGVLRAHACPRCRLVAWYADPGAEVQRV